MTATAWDIFNPETIPPDPETVRELLDQAEKKQQEQKDRERQAEFDEVERRRRAAQDTVRREREEAEISGELSGDAEAFYSLKLKPRLTEAHNYRAKIKTPVVQGLFNTNSLCWTVGSSGTFKSFMTADLAFRYGTDDMDYHGRKMTHGRALIIVAEGEDAYAHRKEAWEKQYQREVKNVTFFPGALQLGDLQKEMPALLHELRREKEAGREYGLIVFDTQAMCTVGMDENTSEMNLVVNVLHRIRETTGACVLVVHHFGKNESKGMRGSSMLYAAADTVLALKRADDAMEVALSTAQADGGKQKDNPTEKDFLTLEMRVHAVGEDYFGDPVTSLAAVASTGGSFDAPDEAPVDVPALTERQLFYLQELTAYHEDGTSPSDFAKDMDSEGSAEPGGGRVTRQSARKVWVQELKSKGLVELVPKSDSKFRATSLGGSAIMKSLADGTPQKWVDRARNRRVRGRVREPYGPELPNPSEPDSEPYSDQGEP